MNVIEKILARLLGFQGYIVPREILYAITIIIIVLLLGFVFSPYNVFTILLSLTLTLLMLPLLSIPLAYKANIRVLRKTYPGLARSYTNIELTIYNESSMPLVVEIEEYIPSLRFAWRRIIGISARGTESLMYRVRGRTGKHVIKTKTKVYDPLGIVGFEKKVIIEGDKEVKFKPRITGIRRDIRGYLTQIVPGGGFRSSLKGLGFDFYGLRKYVYGDPIKLVDWKTSARQRELFVKEYVLETGVRILLSVLFSNESFRGDPSVFENVSEAIVSVADRLLVSGNSLGLVVGAPLYNGLIGVGQGKSILNGVIELLSNVPWLSDGYVDLDAFAKNILRASKHPRNTRLLIILHATDEDSTRKLCEKILRLQKVGFESLNLVILEAISGLGRLYYMLEEKGVKITRVKENDREIIAEKIIEVLGGS